MSSQSPVTVHWIQVHVSVHWITQFILRSHPVRSLTPETVTMTLQLYRSDQLVFTTVPIRAEITSTPVATMAGPLFPYYWNRYPVFPGGHNHFTDASTQGWGPYGGFSDFMNLIPHCSTSIVCSSKQCFWL